MIELDEAFFKAFQDRILQTARRNLRKDRTLAPLVAILVSPGLVPTQLHGQLHPLDGERFRDIPKDGLGVLFAFGQYSEDLGFEVVRDHAPNKEALGVLESMVDMLGKTPEEKRALRGKAAHAFMQAHNLNEKDVFAMWLRGFLKKTHALAYVKVDDTWQLSNTFAPAEEVERHTRDGGSLENNPYAKECICVGMESRLLNRVLLLPYERRRRGDPKSPVKSFETVVEISTDMVWQGRFSNLLEKDQDLPKGALH